MIITIAGCGAIGSLIASRLIQSGQSVQIYEKQGTHLNAIKSDGIIIENDKYDKKTVSCPVAVSDNPDDLAISQLIIVLVKSYHTEYLYPLKTILKKNTIILTLQNGLGNAEKLSRIFGINNLAAGTISYGAYRIAPGKINWGGDGEIVFGAWNGGVTLDSIYSVFNNAGLSVKQVENPKTAIWTKLAINAMINPLTVISGQKNGNLLNNSDTINKMAAIGHETILAAKRSGINIEFKTIWELLLACIHNTAKNKSSMLQDVEAGKETEIESIVGEILKFQNFSEEFKVLSSVYASVKNFDR